MKVTCATTVLQLELTFVLNGAFVSTLLYTRQYDRYPLQMCINMSTRSVNVYMVFLYSADDIIRLVCPPSIALI